MYPLNSAMRDDNNWYGHSSLLAEYTGVAVDKTPAIWGTLYHGWTYNYNPLGRLRHLRAPSFLWNARHLQQASGLRQGPIHAIGAPFIYAPPASQSRKCAGDNASGTLFIPPHSGDGLDYEHDFRRAITQLKAQYPPPYHVSIFFQDWSEQTRDLVASLGCSPVTFGDRRNRRFLLDFIDLAKTKTFIVGSSISSALLYGGYIGLRMGLVDYSPILRGPDGAISVEDDPRLVAELVAPGISHRLLSVEESVAVAESELGHEFQRGPAELRSLLGWDSISRKLKANVVRRLIVR